MPPTFILSAFLSTLSLRRATASQSYSLAMILISIHALLAESDGGSVAGNWRHVIFLSTLSLRRATRRSVKLFRQNYISIHALLAESDEDAHNGRNANLHFYPRSPCGERHLRVVDGSKSSIISIHALLAESDVSFMLYDTSSLIFLSTLSLRRATVPLAMPDLSKGFLSTLSLRRATHYDNYNLHCVEISIHALLAESD